LFTGYSFLKNISLGCEAVSPEEAEKRIAAIPLEQRALMKRLTDNI
jgi:hypothetical protein